MKSWVLNNPIFFFSLGFTPSKAEEQLQGMELQQKEAQKSFKHTQNLLRKNLQLTGVLILDLKPFRL